MHTFFLVCLSSASDWRMKESRRVFVCVERGKTYHIQTVFSSFSSSSLDDDDDDDDDSLFSDDDDIF